MKTKLSKRLTKIFAFICTFSLVAQFAFAGIPVSAATANVLYNVTGTPTVGNTIDIAVNVSGISDLYGGSVDFTYDPTVLQVQSITKGNVVTSDFQIPVNEIKNGQAEFGFTLTGDKKGISATGTIATIKAKVLKGGQTINLNTAAKVKLANSSAGAIDVNPEIKSIVTKDKEEPVTVLQPGAYQENNSAFTFSGKWVDVSSVNYDGGATKVGQGANSSVEFKFNGTSFEWYGIKAKVRGIAKITIDGADVATVDCYQASTSYSSLIYKSNNLTSGTHTVKITVLDTKNPSATSTDIDLDKIVINSSSTILNAGTYQENNSAFIYSGKWVDVSSANYDGGATKVGQGANSSVEFKFNGTSFEWYGIKAKVRGIAKITIDGADVATVDCYQASTSYSSLIYKSDNLTSGTHTVKITVLGTKNPSATSTDIDLDKIVINSSSTILNAGTYQENNSAFIYSGKWVDVSSANYDGGATKVGQGANSSVEFKFNGTSFEWYGIKAKVRGIAKITIDGVDVATVDCYQASTSYKSLIYKSNNLTSGTHTVKITVLGTKNSSATSTDVDLDKIVIS